MSCRPYLLGIQAIFVSYMAKKSLQKQRKKNEKIPTDSIELLMKSIFARICRQCVCFGSSETAPNIFFFFFFNNFTKRTGYGAIDVVKIKMFQLLLFFFQWRNIKVYIIIILMNVFHEFECFRQKHRHLSTSRDCRIFFFFLSSPIRVPV